MHMHEDVSVSACITQAYVPSGHAGDSVEIPSFEYSFVLITGNCQLCCTTLVLLSRKF